MLVVNFNHLSFYIYHDIIFLSYVTNATCVTEITIVCLVYHVLAT